MRWKLVLSACGTGTRARYINSKDSANLLYVSLCLLRLFNHGEDLQVISAFLWLILGQQKLLLKAVAHGRK
jgi:hypothetical protein